MTSECYNDSEEPTMFSSQDDNAIDIVLKVTPLLSFASGPALSDAQTSALDAHPAGLQKPDQAGHHNKQSISIKSNSDSEVSRIEKQESIFSIGRIENLSNGIKEGANSKDRHSPPDRSPTSSRNNKMALIRSFSSSSPPKKELSSRPTRRLSDPTVPSRKLLKGFEKQASLKKLRPYLKQKLSKVASNTGSKHTAQDSGQSKETKGGNTPRLAKRLYPSFSKAYDNLADEERRGPDSSAVQNGGDGNRLANDCGTTMNDFLSQIQDLAVNLENLSSSECHRNELQTNVSSSGKTRQQQGEAEVKPHALARYFKDNDVQLQVMLEDVLKSHLLAMGDYSPKSCDRASRSICKIITGLLGAAAKRSGEGQQKLACLVYIGAVRENGIQMATQALWSPTEDTFAAASFRNESVYGLAVVITTPTY